MMPNIPRLHVGREKQQLGCISARLRIPPHPRLRAQADEREPERAGHGSNIDTRKWHLHWGPRVVFQAIVSRALRTQSSGSRPYTTGPLRPSLPHMQTPSPRGLSVEAVRIIHTTKTRRAEKLVQPVLGRVSASPLRFFESPRPS
jgi:hypothetical protein